MIRHMGSLFISEPKRLASLTVTKDSRQPVFNLESDAWQIRVPQSRR
jgi:hypothetical protein